MYNVVFIILGCVGIVFLIVLLIYVLRLMIISFKEQKLVKNKDIVIKGVHYKLVETSEIHEKEAIKKICDKPFNYPSNFLSLDIEKKLEYVGETTYKNFIKLKKHISSLPKVREEKLVNEYNYFIDKKQIASICFQTYSLVCEINLVGNGKSHIGVKKQSVKGAFKLNNDTSLNGAINTVDLVYKSILKKRI